MKTIKLFLFLLINKYLNLIIFCLVINISVYSQGIIKGTIIEHDTKLPIAFASVTYQKQSYQKGVISDIRGKFEISDTEIKSLTISCIGYRQNKILITPSDYKSKIIIELQKDTININEIIVTPDNNPAIRIIKNILKHKEENNFEHYEKYSYQCYFKTICDIKLSLNASVNDSIAFRSLKSLKKRVMLVSESVALCSHVNNRTENKIIATKMSGFEDPIFNQSFFMFFHNSMSFYNNNIPISQIPTNNGRPNVYYLSPLSDGCINSYNFQLEDSYKNPIPDSTDSIFVINFYPKKGKNFNSLKGKLFVSSNNFAIKSIIAEPFEKGLIDFKVHQDYEFIKGKWFPSKLNEEIGFVSLHSKKNLNAYPVYLITSIIDSVEYNLPINKGSINLEKIYIDQHSLKNSESILNKVRVDSLTIREKNTYHFLDSIGKKEHFDYKIKFLEKFMGGKIPVKCFDIHILKIYYYNKYEKSRVNLGISTNEKISKYISIGGFVGYGFKDEKLKYGGQIVLDINKFNEIQLKLSYQNNLKEAGFDMDDYSTPSHNNYLRNYIGYRFDNIIEEKAKFSFRAFRFLKFTTSISITKIKPTFIYLFKSSLLNDFHADKIQISAKYSYGEELSTMGYQRIINYEGNPIINLTYKRGINFFNKQSYLFNCIEATIDITAYKGRIGQSKITLASGFIDKSLPYSLLFTGEGSKNNDIPLLIKNSFQTMATYEFLSDEYVNLFYSHNFGTLLIERPKFKPQFVIVQNSGWGTLNNPNYQGIDFKIKDKFYFESGLIINNIIKYNYGNIVYIGFGAGAFYRYGSYAYDNFKDNFAYKISISLSFK